MQEFSYDYYREMLEAALRSGYAFLAFPEARQSEFPEPFCLLRHDCDNDLPSALSIAELEHDLGVRSTYFVMVRSAMYNLLSRANSAIVTRIIEMGHHIGLHFDEYLVRDLEPRAVDEEVERECALIEKEFGVGVDVVSFHQPSERVLKGEIGIRRLNTYDNRDTAGSHYISDSWGKMRADLISVFREVEYPRLQLLLHTEWWTRGLTTRSERWAAILDRNFSQMQEELVQREPAYDGPFTLKISTAEKPGD